MLTGVPYPTVGLAGAGAAGLWTALALVDAGWPGERITLVDPDAKVGDDHTWGYWAKEPLVSNALHHSVLSKVLLRANGREVLAPTRPYKYYSLRSSVFYAFAKQKLREAGVHWQQAEVLGFSESETQVVIRLSSGEELRADYVLDSRPLSVDVQSGAHNATLQHFGGYFIEVDNAVFTKDTAVFMDFVPTERDEEIAFFYVIPSSSTQALVELAVLSTSPWAPADYNAALEAYIGKRYGKVNYAISEQEYGVIPMTDEPLWEASTRRVWAIGSRGGWVQPSSGYAFTRCERFGREVAQCLLQQTPTPWRPSAVQQVFNATMLRHMVEHPEAAGETMLNLFKRNGAPRTFAFLDEQASPVETVKLMWSSPVGEFANLAVRETVRRIVT